MSSSAVATFRPTDPPMTPEPARPAAEAMPPLFASDAPGAEHATQTGSARLLADLAAHPDAATPFLVAIHGCVGSGKSSLLRQVVARLGQAKAAPRTLAVVIDASRGGSAESDLVGGILGALATAYPDLAEDAASTGSDPLTAARAAGDRVSDLRRQLDTERQALDEVGGRQARLVDTVLFHTPGSRVDAYARGNRSRIEGRLRAFGLPSSDPVATYKGLVREAAESEGGASRFGMALRSLWGFKGQGTLIVLAILMLVLGWGSAYLADHQDLWVTWLTGLGYRFASATAWAQDHATWLTPISHAAYALAALAVLLAIIRAFRFIQPVMRGASLLNGDLESRRRDIDGLLAHQTRRVDHLAAEVESAVRSSDAAERRVEARRSSGRLGAAHLPGRHLGQPPSPLASAEAVLAGLGAALTAPAQAGAQPAPGRIVVVLDEFDRLPPQAAALYLDTAHRLLAREGFATLAAVDRKHALDGFSDTDPAYAAGRLARCVQLSFDLDAEAAAALTLGAAPDTGEGALARPLQDHETRLLWDLSAFAGGTPRAAKRFANTYRVARADPRMTEASPAEQAGLAMALALDDTPTAAELHGYEAGTASVRVEDPRSELDFVVAAAQRAIGQAFGPVEAQRGLQVARIYSRRG